MLLALPDKRHHRLVRDRRHRGLTTIRDGRIVHDDRTGPFVNTEAERCKGTGKCRLVIVRHQQVAEAGMRGESHGRSDRSGRMGEVEIATLSEVHEMENQHHASRQHAKRGEGMSGEGSGTELKR
jgi:hypothetical protein